MYEGLLVCSIYGFIWAFILIYLIRLHLETVERLEIARKTYDMQYDTMKAVSDLATEQIAAYEIARASYEAAKAESEGIRPN